jgi:hypothetical protein
MVTFLQASLSSLPAPGPHYFFEVYRIPSPNADIFRLARFLGRLVPIFACSRGPAESLRPLQLAYWIRKYKISV